MYVCVQAAAERWHPETVYMPQAAAEHVIDASTGRPTGMQLIPLPTDDMRGEALPEEGAGDAAAAAAAGAHRRRRLQQIAGSGVVNYEEMPSGFTPAASATLPSVLVPVCFHVMVYNDGAAGKYGPPKVDQAAAMAQRLLQFANVRLAQTRFQLFMATDADGAPCVRNDPSKNPYLVMKTDGSGERSRAEW